MLHLDSDMDLDDRVWVSMSGSKRPVQSIALGLGFVAEVLGLSTKGSWSRGKSSNFQDLLRFDF